MVHSPTMLGTTVGKYTITAKIGQGGMAVVYTAQHTELARKAVVKVLRRHLLSDDEIPRRFRNEASAIASIKHPGIVTVMDFGELADGNLYILMEYLEGENLRERLDRQPSLPIEQAMTITRQAADALAAAHASSIVHRDLKPANIFLTRDLLVRGGERVKLLDFGIAKLMDRQGMTSLVTKSNVIMGTPIYMSPEQCRGAGEVDHRTDLYALGCILFEMLCGRPPFDTKAAGELIVLHLTQPAPSARSINSAVPAALDALITHLLVKEPRERLASASELVATLDRIASTHDSGKHHRDGPGVEMANMIVPSASAPGVAAVPTGSAVEFEPTELDHRRLRNQAKRGSDSDHGVAPTERFELDMQAAVMRRSAPQLRVGAQARGQAAVSGATPPAEPARSRPEEALPGAFSEEISGENDMFGSREVTTPWALERQAAMARQPVPRSGPTPQPALRLPAQRSSAELPTPGIMHTPYFPVPQSHPELSRPMLTPPGGQPPPPFTPPAGMAASTPYATGHLTRIGRSRAWWYVQVGFLFSAGVGALIYLIVWMVGSLHARDPSPDANGAHAVMDSGASTASDAGSVAPPVAPHITSDKTRYRPALVALSGGHFLMGTPDGQQWRSKDETPQHDVTLSPFLLCNTEVTQGQWKAVMGENPSECEHGCKENQPVHNVSWYNAVDYFNRLSRKEGLPLCYERNGDTVVWKRPCAGYRFPTEAEWEHAARAGTSTIFSFGDDADQIDEYAWYRGNTDRAEIVASKKPNPWGLYDMHGNVFEWVWDQFERFYPSEPQVDPIGVPREEPKRVFRGGSFQNDAKDLRSAARYWNEPVSIRWDVGLRCARNAP